MKYFFLVTCIFLFTFCFASQAQNNLSSGQEGNKVFLKNKTVRMDFDLSNGLFNFYGTKGDTVVRNAYFQANGLQSKDTCRRVWSVENINDALGIGRSLKVKTIFSDYIGIIWQITLYENNSYFILSMGLDNNWSQPLQLMSFYPIISNRVYEGKDNKENYRLLDGNGGGSPTRVTNNDKLQSFNNLLVKFGSLSHPNILVAGGVSYHEFEKFVNVKRVDKALQIRMFSEDPVGKRIDPGQVYMPDEKFYFSYVNDNPFEALEQYAGVLRKEQKIELNYYDFPTECLWYAAFYNNDSIRSKFNNSKGAVEEMDNANKSGITKYTKVAIRLVPDAYGPNNQQGWWDDKHWGMYNERMSTDLPHYTEPYLTTEGWCKAIIDKGGYPFTYMQSGRRSEDFVKLHPDWMLFNDPYKPYTGTKRLTQESSYPNEFGEDYSGHWWSDYQNWGYDFTDKGFINHMKEVYANLKKAGIKGIFYDYPEPTAWAYEGGFDDPYATTAYAYRQMFQLAADGLGKDALLQERNVVRGSDIALGPISSQRVWGDTDGITPGMVSRCGLRWYKNRSVINYDMDSKDPSDALPLEHNDGNRSMLTMCYVTSGRFLLGRSFVQLSKEQLHDLSRTFPYHTTAQSARPIDAFNGDSIYPRIYDFEVNPSWHQLTFYNYNMEAGQERNTIGVELSKSLNEGGLGLDSSKQYYVYDFWNNQLIGLFNGSQRLQQVLRPGETRMMSVHAKENHPQFISTNRHIMQGYIDLKNENWDPGTKTLSGSSAVVESDDYKIVVATNGYKLGKCSSSFGKCSIRKIDENIIELTISSPKTKEINWKITFK